MKSWMTVSKKPSGAFGGDVRELPQEIPARQGFSISYMGKTLLSRIDPVVQGERIAAEVPMEDGTLYLCPSPLYGYGLSILLKKLKPNSAILCIEADEKLYKISQKAFEALPLENFPLAEQSVKLLRAFSPQEVCVFLRKTWGLRFFRRLKIIRLGGGWQLYHQLYEEIETALRREIAVDWSNAMTLIRLGRLYARNLIRNLSLLKENKNICALNFSSAPLLVLGAGPSLDSFLDDFIRLWGQKIEGKEKRPFRIICADTCLSALIARNIIPDLVVILESQHWNLKDFTGHKNRHIDAAIDMSALPASARVLSGKRFLFFTPWTELRLFKRLNESSLLPEILPPLGSVGLSCVALALRLTSGPVLTAGIDFSYTLDAFHARSTPGHNKALLNNKRLKSLINADESFRDGSFPVISKSGTQVRSDPALRNYRDLFEQEFGNNPRLLDIAGSGLSLGIKTITVAEALSILNSDITDDTTGDIIYDNAGDISSITVSEFARKELDILNKLKQILSGESPDEADLLEELLEKADYLWAHFPECAGTGGRRPEYTDLSFLKRLRAEIEPFLKLWLMLESG